MPTPTPLLLARAVRGLSALFFLLLLAAVPARATHLLGGEMTYRYLDANGPAGQPFRYEITTSVYFNGLYTPGNPNNIAPPNNTINLSLYNRDTGGFIRNVSASLAGGIGTPVLPKAVAGCAVQGPNQPYYLLRYVVVVNLPAAVGGYYAVFTLAARNNTLTNVNNPNGGVGGNVPMTLYVSMSSPLISNRAPIFSDTAVAIICANDTTILLNNAVDPDGDRLVYSFGTPYGNLSGGATFPPLPQSVPYRATFSAANPFGPGRGNFALINANTGTAKYGTTDPNGQFVVAVDVSEYRTINGREVLLGTTRRDLQLVSASCPPTPAPVLPPLINTPRAYTIEAGTSLSVPLRATQSDGHPLVMTLNSVLLDGPGGINATFNNSPGTVVANNPTGTASASGAGAVSGTFVFNSACADARATPYDVVFTVKDLGCAGKTVADVLRITVTKPPGPTTITGDAVVCALNTTSTYAASGGTAPSLRWRVVGGTFVGASTGPSVQVRWTTAGPGTVVARGVTSFGCLTDSVSQAVNVAPTTPLTVGAGGLSICAGSSTTLTVSGGTAPYTLSGGGGPNQTGTGPFTVSPTQTTTYTLTGTTTAQGCVASQTVTVSVAPLPAAAVGNPTRATCSGVPVVLGAAAVGANTYQWSPAAGLSSATVANPTLTLTNTSGAPITQTYTLTETSAGSACTASNTVVVTVNPAVVAVPGPATTTVCSGTPVQLGAAPVAGLTYQWSPATGLSDATSANPVATLTNTSGAAITQTYTLTTTSAATGCTSTATASITVNPAVTAVPGAALVLCSGVPGQLGGPAVAGLTYQWSPATGLSSSTVANPTVSLTNTTGAAITQTYTLITTSTTTACASTATVVVTINPAVVAVPGPATTTVCSGTPVQLGAAPVAGLTYQWSPATGLSDATSANPVATLTNNTGAAITQVYTLTVTSAATGCANTATASITVNPAVTAVPGAALALCSGTSGQLGAAPVAGLTYQWSPATGLSSATVANPTVSLTNTTGAAITQTYTLITTSTTTACASTATVVVTVNPAAVAVAGPAQAVCAGQSITLGAAAVAGTTYQWSPATGLSSATVANPTFTGSNPGTTPLVLTYTLTATTGAGCVASGTVQITVNPQPAAPVVAGAQSVCPTVTGIAYAVVAPGAGLTYQWTVVGGTVASGQGTAAVTVDWGAAGIGSVSTTASNTQGCAASAVALPVVINQVLQTIKPTGPVSVCQADGPYTYTTLAVAGSSWSWQLSGTATGTLVSTANSTSITFTSPGTALLTVTQTSNPAGGICRGVSDALSITVLPSPSPTLSLQGPDRYCVNAGPPTYTLAGAATSTYVFQLNGTGLPNTGNAATLPATLAVGNYTLTARETNANGCVGPLYTKTITVDPRPGALTVSGPRFVCPAARALPYAVANATAGSTFQWTVTGASIASGQGTASITVDFGASSTAPATISVTESSAFGCAGAPVSFQVVPDNALAPQLRLASVVPTDNGKVELTFSVTSPAATPNSVQVLRRAAGSGAAFAVVGSVAATATSFVDATASAGQLAYEYSLRLTNGCGDVLNAPTPATTMLLRAVAEPGSGGRTPSSTNLSWNAYQGFGAVAGYAVFQANDQGAYTLLARLPGTALQYRADSKSQGFRQCFRVVASSADATPLASNSNTACVDFANPTAFYNIITPNGDNKNDKLEIDNVQLYPGNSLTVFNRWGRQVFTTTNYNNQTNFWGPDPSVAPGLYYYLFKTADGTATKGWVEVVR